MVLKPWVLLSSLLLQDHQQTLAEGRRQGMPLDELTARAVWLRDVSRQYGAFLHWPGTALTAWVKDATSGADRRIFNSPCCVVCLLQTTCLHRRWSPPVWPSILGW